MTVQERQSIAVVFLMILIWLSVVGGVGYIAIHFITKFW